MALRDQPYLPLYIQDFLTDEKLNECSAAATGVYAKLMCLMHKSDDYGKMLLKQKYKTSESKERNFALMLTRLLPFSFDEVFDAINELLTEKVLYIDGDFLCQKRMIKDNNLSDIRKKSGQKGGNAAPNKSYDKPGFIYLISDENKHKIGLSTDPIRRLGALRTKYRLPYLQLIDSIEVSDMGASEDKFMYHFKNCIDGEWLTCNYKHATSEFLVVKQLLSKAKTKANAENEIEYDIVIEDENNSEKLEQKKYVRDEILEKSIMAFFGFTETKNQDKQSLIFQFCTSLNNSDQLENFKEQFAAYSEYKALTGFKHSFANFTGEQSELFANGAWNAENWGLKLAEEKAKPSQASKSKFPAYYDKDYAAKLENKELTAYWDHCRALGWTTYKSEEENTKGKTIWLKPGDKRDSAKSTTSAPIIGLANKFTQKAS